MVITDLLLLTSQKTDISCCFIQRRPVQPFAPTLRLGRGTPPGGGPEMPPARLTPISQNHTGTLGGLEAFSSRPLLAQRGRGGGITAGFVARSGCPGGPAVRPRGSSNAHLTLSPLPPATVLSASCVRQVFPDGPFHMPDALQSWCAPSQKVSRG